MKDKRIMSYMGHVIWKNEYSFMVALDRNGTDRHYLSLEDAMKAIDTFEEEKERA